LKTTVGLVTVIAGNGTSTGKWAAFLLMLSMFIGQESSGFVCLNLSERIQGISRYKKKNRTMAI